MGDSEQKEEESEEGGGRNKEGGMGRVIYGGIERC